MGFFKRYREVHDETLHEAVKDSCVAMRLTGASYFLCGKRLVIAYDWHHKVRGSLGEHQGFHAALDLLAKKLPKNFGMMIDLWDLDNIEEEGVPEALIKNTGRVSVYTPKGNRV